MKNIILLIVWATTIAFLFTLSGCAKESVEAEPVATAEEEPEAEEAEADEPEAEEPEAEEPQDEEPVEEIKAEEPKAVEPEVEEDEVEEDEVEEPAEVPAEVTEQETKPEETVEVQKAAEVQEVAEEKKAAVVVAEQQQEVAKEEAQIAVEQDAEKSIEAPKAVTIISAPPEEPETAIQDLGLVYFAYDKSIITPSFEEVIQENYEWIAENPDVQVQLEGHCDERGTNEYNLALGERRAKAVFDYLVSLGASPSQFSMVSFGEERPAASGSNEFAWKQNRRVEFTRL